MFGIEKPFPWVGLAILGVLMCGLVAGVWAAAEIADNNLCGF